MRVVVEGGFASWRERARELLTRGVPPDQVEWQWGRATQEALGLGPAPDVAPGSIAPRVTARFLRLASLVACHRDPARWDLLYRALWRETGGERHLLALATDPLVRRLLEMARAVKRAAHKMKAFVRFRAVSDAGTTDGRIYVAWFEPAHLVVEATAPFFARRFRSMRWSILTPDGCAHWDTVRLRFTPGVSRSSAPTADELEELWRAYYAGSFNPARLNSEAMRSEMPKRYWRNLPEARLIAELSRDAPRRTAEMLARSLGPPEPLPAEMEAVEELPPAPAGWDAVHDPGLSHARERLLRVGAPAPLGLSTMSRCEVLVGVAGWTDPTLTSGNVFYPRGVESPEDRLRFYAGRYPIVEVDSTYYSLPTRGMAVEWARRTPEHFTFDVKAHGLMTGHAADVRRLPDWLRRELPPNLIAGGRMYGRDLPPALLEEVWRRFLAALEPLREAGKLGAVLLQYPRWFQPAKESAAELAETRRRLGAVRGAIELRHHSWMGGRLADRTLGLLRDLDLTYVVVDGPQGLASSMPPTAAVTSPALAVVRLHGRRVETWERRNDPATERYRYLYDEGELDEHLRRIIELSEQKVKALHIIYNNCHGNYAVTNAAELTHLLLLRTSPRSRNGAGTAAGCPVPPS